MYRSAFHILLVLALLAGGIALPLHAFLYHGHDHASSANECRHEVHASDGDAPHNHAGDTGTDPCSFCGRCASPTVAYHGVAAKTFLFDRSAAIEWALAIAPNCPVSGLWAARAPPRNG